MGKTDVYINKTFNKKRRSTWRNIEDLIIYDKRRIIETIESNKKLTAMKTSVCKY